MPVGGTPKPRRSPDALARALLDAVLFASASDSVVVVSSILVVIVINGGAKGKSNEAGFSLCWDSLQNIKKVLVLNVIKPLITCHDVVIESRADPPVLIKFFFLALFSDLNRNVNWKRSFYFFDCDLLGGKTKFASVVHSLALCGGGEPGQVFA